ncbi:lipopolysaccharide assembly protein LapA domain-containing protein [Ancylobacter sp. MQZ15Z-1]|uniref:Lipopolysaccharide assembly protein LapA domain-containing protein n=1 Tax=Ancylobacter mangrovi TaxID=2972472 RepID=A0A9X2T3I0_9HYPH|nr:lipopolysaccharide assembly protein LapA domain-containing protein [Ancylobacter mangrovi]MCS0495021.1 lipopolysaccharide assembly protein LapA domain-containing protein [Ancylobacter mangrovi]
MLRRIVLTLILVPVSVAVIMLAVANRHAVPLMLDPFAGASGMSVELPLFLVVFAALILGVVLGGVSVWLTQGRYRRDARRNRREAQRANVEADALRGALAARTAPAGTSSAAKPASLSLASSPQTPALADRRSAA